MGKTDGMFLYVPSVKQLLITIRVSFAIGIALTCYMLCIKK